MIGCLAYQFFLFMISSGYELNSIENNVVSLTENQRNPFNNCLYKEKNKS